MRLLAQKIQKIDDLNNNDKILIIHEASYDQNKITGVWFGTVCKNRNKLLDYIFFNQSSMYGVNGSIIECNYKKLLESINIVTYKIIDTTSITLINNVKTFKSFIKLLNEIYIQ